MTHILAATGGLVALVVVYAGSCTFWPFRRCWCCKGSGRHERGDRKAFRLCRWCDGTSRRMRLGRRAWNHWRRRRLAAR